MPRRSEAKPRRDGMRCVRRRLGPSPSSRLVQSVAQGRGAGSGWAETDILSAHLAPRRSRPGVRFLPQRVARAAKEGA